MANLTNSDLSVLCTSTANWQYIKAQLVAATPVSNLGVGKAGDYWYEAGANKDSSLHFKTSTGWVSFIVDASVS